MPQYYECHFSLVWSTKERREGGRQAGMNVGKEAEMEGTYLFRVFPVSVCHRGGYTRGSTMHFTHHFVP